MQSEAPLSFSQSVCRARVVGFKTPLRPFWSTFEAWPTFSSSCISVFKMDSYWLIAVPTRNWLLYLQKNSILKLIKSHKCSGQTLPFVNHRGGRATTTIEKCELLATHFKAMHLNPLAKETLIPKKYIQHGNDKIPEKSIRISTGQIEDTCIELYLLGNTI